VHIFQSSRPAKIVLIEPRALLRDSFVRRFASEADLEVEAVSNIDDLRSREFNLVVVHIAEPDHGETLRVTLQAIGQLGSGASCVVLSDTEDPQHVVDALEAGAKGYITMSMPFAVVSAVLRLVAAGGTFAPAKCLMGMRPEAFHVAKEKSAIQFTARQAAVVDALTKGMANKMIAYELNLRESTVKVHVRKIMRKLNATNRTQAAFLAVKLQNADEPQNSDLPHFTASPIKPDLARERKERVS
jgi:DNA-binding NarL/FixJ family response regulator